MNYFAEKLICLKRKNVFLKIEKYDDNFVA